MVDPSSICRDRALSADQIAGLAAEADVAVRGLQVRNLQDSVGGGLLLLIGPSADEPIRHRLLFVAEPGRARAHLAKARRVRKTDRPPISAFTRDAHKRITEATIVAVRAAPGERIVECVLSGPAGTHRLIAELFGPSPNLILIDEQGHIHAARRRRGGRRAIEVGGLYTPPPPPRDRPVVTELAAESRDADAASPAAADAASPAAADDFVQQSPLSNACDDAFADADADAAFQVERDALLRRVHAEIERAGRLVAALNEQAASGAGAGALKEDADLLSASFHLLKSGLSRIVVEDHYRGGQREIAIDPALGPRQNVDQFYRRARRLALAREGALKRVPAAARRLSTLEDLLKIAPSDPDSLATLNASFAALAEDRGPKKPPAVKGLKRAEADSLAGLRSFRTCSGLEVLVGKSNRDNDFLTGRVARGNDIWLHVQGDAGSHVVIRLPKQRVAAPEDLEDAGALAVHFSKRRGARAADVQFTARKHVKKPKGAAPGAVLLDRFKTLRVVHDERRMARLFGGAPDDGGVTGKTAPG